MCVLLISVLFSLLFRYCESVRVCETFADYYDPVSKNCFNNVDAEKNTTQILRSWGCTVEEHMESTKDGYDILVVRAYMAISKETPIILAHGIAMNSLVFVVMYNKTIAYNLVHSGYQIFLINFRGTRYSTGHAKFTENDEAYWNFSFHQMGIYDIPATLKLVDKITGQKSIFIGYSMGSTASYIYSSIYPKDASNNLKGIISLAPIATFKDAVTFIKRLAVFWRLLRPTIGVMWKGKIPFRNEKFNEYCASSPVAIFLCLSLMVPAIGDDWGQVDPLYAPVTEMQLFDDTGLDVVIHYAQIIESGVFRQFDYGRIQNLLRYGRLTPPSYDVSKISVPMALFAGPNDWLASTGDATKLYNKLNSNVKCGLTYVPSTKWNHMDFIAARDMNSTLNNVIMEKIIEMESGPCF